MIKICTMKQCAISLMLFLTLNTFSQDKSSYIVYNKLTEISGTEFVVASIENYGKGFFAKGEHLLFINTKNGESKKTEFPKDAQIYRIEQIRIDSLSINNIIVVAKTINTNGDKGIDWKDPQQVFVFSPDGKQLAQLTDNNFFSSAWVINRHTGTIIISGHYDTNKNGENNKTDKDEVLIFDLKSYKLVGKI